MKTKGLTTRIGSSDTQNLLKMNSFSKVEQSFLKISGINKISTTTPYIIAPDLPKLSLMIALRFIEWVAENPDGVISLPADKHASLFIRFTHQI